MSLPEEWHAVIRKLAGKRRQPALWYLLSLVQAEAQKEGVPLPPGPWDDADDAGAAVAP